MEKSGLENPNPNRQTGRTFRTILKGLLLASEGENVEITCRNYVATAETFRLSLKIVESYGIGHIKDSSKHVIQIPNGGVLKFKSQDVVRSNPIELYDVD